MRAVAATSAHIARRAFARVAHQLRTLVCNPSDLHLCELLALGADQNAAAEPLAYRRGRRWWVRSRGMRDALQRGVTLNDAPRHADNPRKLKRIELRGARRGLIGIEVIIAALAVAVLAIGSRSPRSAIALIVLIGVTQALGAIMLSLQLAWARRIALAAALVAILFAVAQILVFDVVTWFELSLLGVGVLESVLVAGCTPRDS